MLLAKKKNMSQIFDEKGKVIPVTILDYSECFVKKGEKRSGNFLCIGKKRAPGKQEKGIFGEEVPQYFVPLDAEVTELSEPKEGEEIKLSAISKGKGFAGVVKLWKFKGGPKTHGQSDRVRHPGSIGPGQTTQRIYKGLKMGRRMGNEATTIRNVKIAKVDTENKLICIVGSVPGGYNSIITLK